MIRPDTTNAPAMINIPDSQVPVPASESSEIRSSVAVSSGEVVGSGSSVGGTDSTTSAGAGSSVAGGPSTSVGYQVSVAVVVPAVLPPSAVISGWVRPPSRPVNSRASGNGRSCPWVCRVATPEGTDGSTSRYTSSPSLASVTCSPEASTNQDSGAPRKDSRTGSVLVVSTLNGPRGSPGEACSTWEGDTLRDRASTSTSSDSTLFRTRWS